MDRYKKIVNDYLELNKEEREKLSDVCDQLGNKDDISMIDRKNFIGHFTASTFVISSTSKKLLMIHHKALDKYLQPGGHIELSDANPLEGSKRELFEETGIDAKFLEYRCINSLNPLVPLNISVHIIPENLEKKEKAHYHYDLQYLFFARKELRVNIDPDEVNSFEWIDLGKLEEMSEYKIIAEKIKTYGQGA